MVNGEKKIMCFYDCFDEFEWEKFHDIVCDYIDGKLSASEAAGILVFMLPDRNIQLDANHDLSYYRDEMSQEMQDALIDEISKRGIDIYVEEDDLID